MKKIEENNETNKFCDGTILESYTKNNKKRNKPEINLRSIFFILVTGCAVLFKETGINKEIKRNIKQVHKTTYLFYFLRYCCHSFSHSFRLSRPS